MGNNQSSKSNKIQINKAENLVNGNKKGYEVTPRDRAVLELKVQRDRLKQYRRQVMIVMAREHEIAREHVRQGNKQLALLALRKRRYQETLLESTAEQLLNVEQLVMNIEFTSIEAEVFASLKTGNTVLATLQKEVSLSDVEQLMAETADAVAYQQQISDIVSASLTTQDSFDCDAELERLLAEAIPTVDNEKSVLTECDAVNDAVTKTKTEIVGNLDELMPSVISLPLPNIPNHIEKNIADNYVQEINVSGLDNLTEEVSDQNSISSTKVGKRTAIAG